MTMTTGTERSVKHFTIGPLQIGWRFYIIGYPASGDRYQLDITVTWDRP